MEYNIKEDSLLARIAAWKLKSKKVAIVFGKTIHLCRTSKEEFLADQKWLQHELKHIEQFRQHGFTRFIFLYLREWVKNGYVNNKYEKEARVAEGDCNHPFHTTHSTVPKSNTSSAG